MSDELFDEGKHDMMTAGVPSDGLTASFRLFVDDNRDGEFILVTEPLGREIVVAPGSWVDVEVDTSDEAPAEVWARADGTIAVWGRAVVVTDEAGNERLF